MRFRTMAAAAAGLCIIAGGQALAAPPVVSAPLTTVEGLEVTASPDVRVSVAVGGDLAADTVVTSAPVGLNCGGALYQYRSDQNRQCWLWVRRRQPLLLTAQANGHFGHDWTVTWVGCEPVGNGAACQVATIGEREIGALFSRLPGATPAVPR